MLAEKSWCWDHATPPGGGGGGKEAQQSAAADQNDHHHPDLAATEARAVQLEVTSAIPTVKYR